MNAELKNYRTGESWEQLLKKYRLKNVIGSEPWKVESESGNTYYVRRVLSNSYEDRMLGTITWHMICNCHARKQCRHIDAVECIIEAEAERDDWDIIERTID